MVSLVRMELLPVMKLLGGCVLLRLRKFENSTGAYAARACETFSVLICGDSRSAWIPRLFSRAIRTASSALSRMVAPLAVDVETGICGAGLAGG